jgi:hypothetical protein
MHDAAKTIYHLPITPYRPMNQASQQPSNPAILNGYINTYHVLRNGNRFGPYHVRRWKVGRKIHKQYIKPADLEWVRAACEAYKQRRKRMRAKDRELDNLVGNLNYLTKIAKRQDQGPLTPEDEAHMRRIKEHGFAAPGRPSLRRTLSELLFARYGTRVTTHNSQPQKVMVPFFTKRRMNTLKKDIMRMFDARQTPETAAEKWQRWREKHSQRPKKLKSFNIPLPEWITEDEIDSSITDYFEGIHQRKGEAE